MKGEEITATIGEVWISICLPTLNDKNGVRVCVSNLYHRGVSESKKKKKTVASSGVIGFHESFCQFQYDCSICNLT